MQRYAQHRSTEVGDAAVGVEGVEHGEQFASLYESRAGWLVEEAQLIDVDAPRSEFECSSRQIDLEDLGFDLGAT